MPKLIKFFLSNKKLFLFLLYYIYIYVHLAIITGSNVNFKLKEKTEITIQLLNKKEYLEKGKQKYLKEYLDKYKEDPIKNTNIYKDHIIFSSKTEIIDFLKKNYNLELSLDDLNKNELDDLNKNEFIVKHYNEKYNSKNLSYIYFVKTKDILKKVLLFWNIDEINEAKITIEAKDSKNITSSEKSLYKSVSITQTKPLYYLNNKINNKINVIYFDIQNYRIETLLRNLSNYEKDNIYKTMASNLCVWKSNEQNQSQSQNKIFFVYDTACN
ncbi:hypothetical protein [Candidatus Phytoplasma sp. AldY-WA1]|uniref:hypothetical protein n=1 Tax=Candidatus Phytoplasma sp. AldY-WA1 TaxID=2852100 RepID=UPI00254DE6C6|nr:hypothetical protein [Candidatus Phytoplasma sp. AldY-WA1]